MLFILLSFGLPALEDGLNIAQGPFIATDRNFKGFLDPTGGITFL